MGRRPGLRSRIGSALIILTTTVLGTGAALVAVTAIPPSYRVTVLVDAVAPTTPTIVYTADVLAAADREIRSAGFFAEVVDHAGLDLSAADLARIAEVRIVYGDPQISAVVTGDNASTALMVARAILRTLQDTSDDWLPAYVRDTGWRLVPLAPVDGWEDPVTPKASHDIPAGAFLGLGAGALLVIALRRPRQELDA